MSESCSNAYNSTNSKDWYENKEDCIADCSGKCNECGLSGYTQTFYGCMTQSNKEKAIVYGEMAGGNQGTYELNSQSK